MTKEELEAWGDLENSIRLKELEVVVSQADLERIQKETKKRRNKVGLSMSQASRAVRSAQVRAKMREALK